MCVCVSHVAQLWLAPNAAETADSNLTFDTGATVVRSFVVANTDVQPTLRSTPDETPGWRICATKSRRSRRTCSSFVRKCWAADWLLITFVENVTILIAVSHPAIIRRVSICGCELAAVLHVLDKTKQSFVTVNS